MSEDRIERDITIAAPVERVWAVLTEPEHVGSWFGQGKPTPVDLRPGGTMHFDHGEYGQFPTTIVKVDPPHHFSYRWASAHPGEQAVDGNSTLVEFTLTPDGEGTHLRVVETGFADLVIPEDRVDTAGYESHSSGWTEQMDNIKKYAERLAA
ncbi:SRPBCC family protein [Streptomyces lunaelactis]|uniref:SRPBCC family protein n=1 Tax=Streptomyces lunaelactis TaxID=1535768 RepID=UPI0015851C55|nr:SRPBCC family protein [Streptomyces lunaelactis]NUJ99698.1 SRPBCC family protein [Streptomyces lunaelactis]NUK08425.1 SRPBCC family protein [Streptomyces lunaelactis]NUK19602.1 SRPBCC family protein [Streptomyces lunaelactis]NUK26117.1 SRPBCC family protein [Streptomyces lunaelactis]NUK35354.1 SRPBCC family protein [Streptomyces lunaelactis]